MKVIGYFAFSAFCIFLLYGVSLFNDHGEPVTLTNDIIEPDILLSNSKQYFEEHAYMRSLEHLKSAIDAIEVIEESIDEESREKVDKSVQQLKVIYEEMSHDSFDISQLNEASVKALNALTYAELKVSEHFVESHMTEKAKVALHYGMLHVKNALKFSEGSKKEYELEIYHELDSLIQSGKLTNKEVLVKIENMITDLEQEGFIQD
ncbi:MAG: hypothetical protein RJQ14_15735 [Marinoscillum sp.]